MCGICGIIKYDTHPPDPGILLKMIGRLKHRGPDSSGYYRDRRAALGHTRLSIIDLAGGAQPLTNEDGSLWIVFNGEIYNYLELASELKSAGHRFSTRSDTEVIVHAYEQWGSDCFRRFNGQWAIALWDTTRQELILSRDRHGIRPLYYTRVGGKFLFASEIKAIFADPDVSRAFDLRGLNEIFTFWSTVAPATCFSQIHQLPPGVFAVLKEGELKTENYWDITFPEVTQADPRRVSENSRELKEQLIKAARLRFTRSDVPVGAYLSGGIDSSITSSIITHYTDTPLKTFSIRFSDEEFDEGGYQKQMVERLGAEHESIKVAPRDIGEIFPRVIWHAERPLLRTAPDRKSVV